MDNIKNIIIDLFKLLNIKNNSIELSDIDDILFEYFDEKRIISKNQLIIREALIEELLNNSVEVIECDEFGEKDFDIYNDCLNGNSIGQYLKEIIRYPLLNSEEEKDVAHKIDSGDSSAKELMINSNLRLVVNIAKKYLNKGVDYLDLIQAGNKGLMKAVDRYDVSLGFKFSTYAVWWIRRYILFEIDNNSRTIRVPRYMNAFVSKIVYTSNELCSLHGGIPTTAEIALVLGVDEDKVSEALELTNSTLSLSAPINTEDGPDDTFEEYIRDDSIDVEDEACNIVCDRDFVDIIDKLPERQQYVIKLRYGLIDGKTHTFKEIAKIMGITGERVRQIEGKAFWKLKNNPDVKALRLVRL